VNLYIQIHRQHIWKYVRSGSVRAFNVQYV